MVRELSHEYKWQDDVQSLIDRQLMHALMMERDVEKVKQLHKEAEEILIAVADLVDGGGGWPVFGPEEIPEPREAKMVGDTVTGTPEEILTTILKNGKAAEGNGKPA
jgi:hypothetical protein